MNKCWIFMMAVTITVAAQTSAHGDPWGLFKNCSDCDAACPSIDSGCCDDLTVQACDEFGCDPCGCDQFGCDDRCDSCGREAADTIGKLIKRWSVYGSPCGRYVSLMGGWNFLHDYSGNADVAPFTATRASFNDGWALGGAIGRRLTSSIRAEVEWSVRDNTGDQWQVGAGAPGDWSGHLYGYSSMHNLLLDLHQLERGGMTPYVGAGIGMVVLDGDFETAATQIEIDDEAFAYQFIAGFSRRVSARMALFAEYRYYGTSEVDVVNTGVAPNANVGVEELESENLWFGVRFFR